MRDALASVAYVSRLAVVYSALTVLGGIVDRRFLERNILYAFSFILLELFVLPVALHQIADAIYHMSYVMYHMSYVEYESVWSLGRPYSRM